MAYLPFLLLALVISVSRISNQTRSSELETITRLQVGANARVWARSQDWGGNMVFSVSHGLYFVNMQGGKSQVLSLLRRWPQKPPAATWRSPSPRWERAPLWGPFSPPQAPTEKPGQPPKTDCHSDTETPMGVPCPLSESQRGQPQKPSTSGVARAFSRPWRHSCRHRVRRRQGRRRCRPEACSTAGARAGIFASRKEINV